MHQLNSDPAEKPATQVVGIIDQEMLLLLLLLLLLSFMVVLCVSCLVQSQLLEGSPYGVMHALETGASA